MGPEADLIVQVKKALHQVRVPVYYDGQKHDAEYPQVIIDLSNIQNEPREKANSRPGSASNPRILRK